MSDTRPVLRRHFEVDAESIVIAAFDALRQAGQVDGARVAEVIAALDYDPAKPSALEI
jgi:pyruvate dehydrogenase E1 component